jgi:hypothetical protein
MLANLQISKPSIFWCGFLFVVQFIYGFTSARTGGSEIAFFWYALAFYWALSWWFITDSRKHGIGWADEYMDLGMFLYIGWILLVPYYLFKTRGWKALYTIGLLFGTAFGAYIAGAIFYLITSIFLIT